MSSDRIHYLNGLRGLLAIIVFLHHFFFIFYPELIFGGSYAQFVSNKWTFERVMAATPLNLLFNPGMAINFFFLLSGYVQTYHYLKTEDTGLLQRAFLKRYFRLALPVLAVVLLVFLFHRLGLLHKGLMPANALNRDWVQSMLPDNLNFLQVLRYAVSDCFNGDAGYYQVLWTMSTELYNSWMVLILLFVTHRIKNKMPLFLIWLAAQLVLLQSFYAVSFTLGLLLCHWHQRWPGFNKLFARPAVKILIGVVGLYFASYPFTSYEHATGKSMYAPIDFFDRIPHVISFVFGNLLLFIFLLHSYSLKQLLSKKWLLFFGHISYMFYLLHFLILFSFSAWLYHALNGQLVQTANLWLTGLASFAMGTLASYVLYRLVDAPVVRACNVATKKIFGL